MDIGKTVKPRSSGEWRRWLARHHADRNDIWVIYYKKGAGKSGINYEDSVVEGLAYGWVDSQAKTIDAATYAVRFTPRKPTSNWSASNIARVKQLIAEGRMAEPGLATLPLAIFPRLRGRAALDSLPRSRGRVRVGAKELREGA